MENCNKNEKYGIFDKIQEVFVFRNICTRDNYH